MSYSHEFNKKAPKLTKPQFSFRKSFNTKCGCGGGCNRCSKKVESVKPHVNYSGINFSKISIQRARRSAGNNTTNYAFDTYNLTASHLSDPDIIARLQALSTEQLVEYRQRVSNGDVQFYINNLIQNRAPVPCTAAEVTTTTQFAEQARLATLPWISLARRGLDRLHSRWINHKRDILAKKRTLSGDPVCAFDSNFNTNQREADYGVSHIRVARRLKSLEKKMSQSVAYSCQSITDPLCSGKTNSDTIAYVRGARPPIHFCKQFRTDPDPLSRQGVTTHEFSHLLPGVGDAGGYAVLGPQSRTCSSNVKFSATTSVLRNTADALTGFVLHLGQTQNINVRSR